MMPKHILVVDNEQEIADTTVEAIVQFGNGQFSAEAAYGGKECLDRIAQNGDTPIDLVLLDLDMPGVNGADVIRALLKQTPLPSFKVMVATGWGPEWMKVGKLLDIGGAPSFRTLVYSQFCDKKDDIEKLVPLLQQVFGDGK